MEESIIDEIVLHLEANGIKCTLLPSHDSYSLEHDLCQDRFQSVIDSLEDELDIFPQADNLVPGNPEGDGLEANEEAWGWYYFGYENDPDNDDAPVMGTEVQIFISMQEIQWE
jgi:hypothetical protein